MVVNVFKCKCGVVVESIEDSPACSCGQVLGLKELWKIVTRRDSKVSGKVENWSCGGQAPGFYSYDLGMQIEGSSHLKKVLKERKMVTLTDSREKRDYDTEMLDRARSGEFDKCKRNR